MTQETEQMTDSKGQKSDIPPRPSSIEIHSKVTPDIPQRQPNTPDKTMCYMSKWGSIKCPIPNPRDEKYAQQDPLNVSLPQTSIYGSNLKEQNISAQSKLSHVGLDTFGHIKRDKYTIK